MTLSITDSGILEKYFEMEEGYVLSFTNASFSRFFADLGYEIYNEKYAIYGNSKAKRLRAFFALQSSSEVSTVIEKLVDFKDAERANQPHLYSDSQTTLRENCLSIATKLKTNQENNELPDIQSSIRVRDMIREEQKTMHQKFLLEKEQQQNDRSSLSGTLNALATLKAKAIANQSRQINSEQSFEHHLHSRNLEDKIQIPKHTQKEQQSHRNKREKVFIVHGHNELMTLEVENYCRRLKLEPIILRDRASKGQTIIEKLEQNTDVSFAVVLYSACDVGKSKNETDFKPRARQNVVFEHGFCRAKLGRENVVALVEDGVEQPGDVGGVVYVSYSGNWESHLIKEFKESGLDVDANDLL